jgi:3-oxoacyl-[acyl-carrier-protein] synthase II
VKTPAGNNAGELWENLCAGRPSAEVFSDDRLPPGTAALVCRVSGFDPAAYLTPVEVRRLDRSHALAIGAAADALGQCGELPPPARRAVVCGIGLGAAATYEGGVETPQAGRAGWAADHPDGHASSVAPTCRSGSASGTVRDRVRRLRIRRRVHR